MNTTDVRLFYKTTLFDPRRDEMAEFLVTKYGLTPDISRGMIYSTWDYWVSKVANNYFRSLDRAERIMDATLSYLVLAGMSDEDHGPSAEVDLGWHTALSGDSMVYDAVCNVLCGMFIHHHPTNLIGFDP